MKHLPPIDGLHYHREPQYNRAKFNLYSQPCILAQIRLYRFFRNTKLSKIEKDGLIHTIYDGNPPPFAKRMISRILASIVPYAVHSQQNPTKYNNMVTKKYYRWLKVEEMIYGLECAMIHWMEAWITEPLTPELFKEELNFLVAQRPEDDIAMLRDIPYERL